MSFENNDSLHSNMVDTKEITNFKSLVQILKLNGGEIRDSSGWFPGYDVKFKTFDDAFAVVSKINNIFSDLKLWNKDLTSEYTQHATFQINISKKISVMFHLENNHIFATIYINDRG